MKKKKIMWNVTVGVGARGAPRLGEATSCGARVVNLGTNIFLFCNRMIALIVEIGIFSIL